MSSRNSFIERSVLIFDQLALTTENEIVDLWDYEENGTNDPLIFTRGAVTTCVEIANMSSYMGKMKAHIRKIRPKRRLNYPYLVYVR